MKIKMAPFSVKSAVVASVCTVLLGCAATQTILEHHNLEVSTKQSETVFLDPVPKSQKTVYLSVKNTSDEDVQIAPQLKTVLQSHGYQVVNNSQSAHYLLQANIRKVGKMSRAASQSALGGGYGSAIAGAIAGTAAGSFTNSNSGMLAGGIAGGVIGLAADSLVKEVNYTMITDVQISERVAQGVRVTEQFQSQLQQGSATHITQSASRASQYQRYRTRIVSNANKVNLNFADAKSSLEQGLVKVIAGIFDES